MNRIPFTLSMPAGVVAAIATVLLASSHALATQVYPISVEQMAEESSVIVRARVGTQQVRWDRTHTRILTLTKLHVLEGIAGASAGDELTIYQVGGTLDGVTFKIPGALSFTLGEEIVFFAVRFEDMIASYGMGLGKYVVSRSEGHVQVQPAYGNVTFMEPASGVRRPMAAPASEPTDYEDFKKRVLEARGQGGEQ